MVTTTAAQLRLKNLLVPIDFSPRSKTAVGLARAIAEKHDSTIYLANVIEGFDVSGMSTDRRAVDVAKAMTDFRALELKYLAGIKHETLVLDGDVNHALLRAIDEQHIDLTVMSTRAAAGCERLFVGSFTEELFREARCPVMAIGPNVSEEVGHFASFGHVLYPIEITPSSIAAIPYIDDLIDACDARVTLLHVVHPDIQSPSERQRIRERLGAEMRKLFPERIQQSLDVIIEFGPIPETIVEFAVAERADLVVLGVRAGGSFTRSATHIPWSIAHKIIAEAPCPVLTIRGHRGETP